jgi:hypothetical protein
MFLETLLASLTAQQAVMLRVRPVRLWEFEMEAVQCDVDTGSNGLTVYG